MMLKYVFVLLILCDIGWSFRMSCGFLRATRKFGVIDGNFNGKDFDNMLKVAGPIPTKKVDPSPHKQFKLATTAVAANSSESDREQLYRVYPKADLELPMLQDCNNYYSGTFKDIFWHQNADNFFLFLPIAEDIVRSDIHVQFEALSVNVKIRGETVAQFPTENRLIPAGSFWLFDRDKHGQRYLHLDIEKRYRMINWNHLFGEPETLSQAQAHKAQSELLKQINEANAGLAKLRGVPAESMEDMLGNEELMNMIDDADDALLDQPMITRTHPNGTQYKITPAEAGIDWDPTVDGVVDLKQHARLVEMLEKREARKAKKAQLQGKEGGGEGQGDEQEGESEGEGDGVDEKETTRAAEEEDAHTQDRAQSHELLQDPSSDDETVTEGEMVETAEPQGRSLFEDLQLSDGEIQEVQLDSPEGVAISEGLGDNSAWGGLVEAAEAVGISNGGVSNGSGGDHELPRTADQVSSGVVERESGIGNVISDSSAIASTGSADEVADGVLEGDIVG